MTVSISYVYISYNNTIILYLVAATYSIHDGRTLPFIISIIFIIIITDLFLEAFRQARYTFVLKSVI